MDWEPIVKILGPIVLAIAIFIEVYKKVIKKDKFSALEVWIVAGFLSASLTTVGYFAFDLAGHPIAIVYYTALVYALQFIFDMKVIKAIGKELAKRKGVTLDGFEWNE